MVRGYEFEVIRKHCMRLEKSGHLIENTLLSETKRIKSTPDLPPEELHFQLEELLGKEVKLLQTIDRLKISAAKINKTSNIKSTLEKMASPKEWSAQDGDIVEVETPFTMRAKELVDLYNGKKGFV